MSEATKAEKRVKNERLAYYRLMGIQALKILSEKGNFVGEKSSPKYTLEQYVQEHETAYQHRIYEEANGLSVAYSD